MLSLLNNCCWYRDETLEELIATCDSEKKDHKSHDHCCFVISSWHFQMYAPNTFIPNKESVMLDLMLLSLVHLKYAEAISVKQGMGTQVWSCWLSCN